MGNGLGAEPPNPTPRHAATVVVARPATDGNAVELYMVRRSARSPFMPSTLVFPGGRLDPEDGPASSDQAWELAARRECAEEIGLALSGPLLWFDTWLTPSAEPRRRYLARFFLAQLAANEGGEAEADGHETHDGRWATVEDHLAAWRRGEIDLPPPTACTLLRLRPLGYSRLEELGTLDPREPILPKWLGRGGEHYVVMPHDPEYPQLDGDGLPAPQRAQQIPLRFIRTDKGWRPCEA